MDAGVGDAVSSAGLQLCRGANCPQPPAAVGPQTSGRSGRELRMMQTTSRIPISAQGEAAWVLPSRGIIGMACLIVAESAIFMIFVVAYIYYIGKSLSGPTPRGVLELPILGTVCLLSSSFTVHAAVSALRKNNVRTSTLWLAATVLLGAVFLMG